MTVVATVATVVQAGALGALVAAVIVGHRPLSRITGYLWLLGAAMVVKALVAGASEWVGQMSSLKVRAELRLQLLAAAAGTGARNLSQDDRSHIAAVSSSGLESLDPYVSKAIPAVVGAVVTPPIVLGAIGLINWLALALLLVTLPLVPVFMVLIGVATKRHMERRWAQLARLSGQFLDLLEGLTSLKIYGKARGQVAAIADGAERLRRHTNSTLRVAFASGLVLDLLATLSVALVAVTVGLRLDSGKVDLRSALTVLLLAPEVFAPIRAVGAQHHATEEARTVVGTILELLHRPVHRSPSTRTSLPFLLRADALGFVVRLRGVGLTYPGRVQPALSRVELDVAGPGLTVLTGPSGAGKSTLLAVLGGQLAPEDGDLRVGADATSLPAGERWLENVAWLPQRPRLTCPDVAAEIRMGDADLEDDDLLRIAHRCGVPPGDTALGEDGSAVSAGQRRRIALARAVARAERVARNGGVPLVLLDEPTEDLDAGTSSTVRAVLRDLASSAAVVVATHDHEIIELADYEVAIVDGHVLSCRPAGRSAAGAVPAIADSASAQSAGGHGRGGSPTNRAVAPTTRRGVGARGLLVRWVWRSVLDAPGASRSLVYAGALGALAGISGLALTATSVWLICRAAQHPNVQALALAVVGVRTFALSKAILRYGERLAAHDGALRLMAALRVRVFSALEPLAPAGLGEYRRGDLLRRFTADVDGAQEALVRAAVPLVGSTATALAALAVCFTISPRVAVVLLAGLTAGGFLVPALTHWAAGDSTAPSTDAGRRDAMANNVIDSLEELTAYGMVEDRLGQVADADRKVSSGLRRPIRAASAGTAAAGLVSAATLTVVLAIGTTVVATGPVTAVDLGVLAALVLVAFDALSALPAALAALGRCAAGLGRVEEVLERPAPVASPRQPSGGPELVGALTMSRVGVAPAAGVANIIEEADLSVAAGERVAVVGPSGAGKSTLLTAALGLIEPSSGRVELSDGRSSVAVTALTPEARARLIAGSLQGDHVFATTLRDNLRMVAPTATDADLDRVARRVGLHGFVSSLPDGWSTQAGADGANLSGGQRQRLLLARALLSNPQVLVLDEPTAHLDSRTEATVMADLMDSTSGMTVLLSTHRLALLQGCDRVLGLRAGRLETAEPSLAVAPG